MADEDDPFAAITSGDAAALQRALELDPSRASARDGHGVSLVRFALYRGRRDLAAVAIEAGARLDVFDAAAAGDADRLAEVVQEDPAAATAFSSDGFTALHFAAFLGGPACARVLLDAGASPRAIARGTMTVQPLHSAAASGDVEVALLLLEAGAPVDAQQSGGYTALHEAAQSGNAALVDVLLRFGADRTVATDDGAIAADVARRAGHPTIADRLC